MKTPPPAATLVQFFDFDNPSVRKDALTALNATAGMRGVQALLTAAPALLQNHAAQSATEALQAALDVKVIDILAAAWNTRRDLAQYTDRTKFPPDQIIDHALSKHDIRSTHKPRLQIMLDHSEIGPEIEFEVTISLTVESASLRIQDGRIMFARLGKAHGTGTIKCESATLFTRPTKAVALPLTVSFGNGLAIGKPKTAAGTAKPDAAAADAA
ncbi:MAG: hypothetical protein KBA31_15545 [Alphaproteobacteria bacterium]|nr:hypothetical protein [Alphaproteobacteria bacterium]